MWGRFLCWIGWHRPRPVFERDGRGVGIGLYCSRKGCGYFYGNYDELT